MDGECGPEMVERVLSGDPLAVQAFLDEMLPVIRRRVTRTLLRRRDAAMGRDLRQDIEDLSQDTVVFLFSKGGRALRQWQPERGLSLTRYVGFLAERTVQQVMRSKRQNPWTDQPAAPQDLPEQVGGEPSPADRAEAREVLERLFDRLTAELSVKGRQVLEMLMVEQLEAAEVAARTGMKVDAVYAWRRISWRYPGRRSAWSSRAVRRHGLTRRSR